MMNNYSKFAKRFASLLNEEKTASDDVKNNKAYGVAVVLIVWLQVD